MPYYQSGDFKLYFEEHGQGEPIIFLHGFTLDRRVWGPQIKFFSASYRVIVVDARGHGKSDAPKTDYGRTFRIDDLLRLFEHLNIKKAHLVGLSMGGSTAIGFALKHQELLKSLTLVSTGAAGFKPGRKVARVDEVAKGEGVESARKYWLEWNLIYYKDKHQDVGKLLKKMIEEHSGAVWADSKRGNYPRMNDLEHVNEITVPTLLIAGEKDKIFVPLAEELHKKIKGSRLEIMKGAGHILNLEFPQEFNREVESFLKTV
ncbi:MAG TPA: alpha/beta hydrolase [candidate division Zixibacteria bacterium]|nr:alpha/beta hydrolase [candidate division Zixibacteria bacterium]